MKTWIQKEKNQNRLIFSLKIFKYRFKKFFLFKLKKESRYFNKEFRVVFRIVIFEKNKDFINLFKTNKL